MKGYTPYFPLGTKPFHVGVYPTEHGYQHWNGSYWGGYTVSPLRAACASIATFKSRYQQPRWRGFMAKFSDGSS